MSKLRLHIDACHLQTCYIYAIFPEVLIIFATLSIVSDRSDGSSSSRANLTTARSLTIANVTYSKDPTAQLEQLRRSSLIGPGDLKMPERKLSQRQMPESSASISHSASNQSNIPDTIGEDGETVLTARNDSSGTASAATGGSSFFSLDGAQSSPLLFGSTSDRTSYSATSNTSRKTTPATIQQDRSTGLDTADSSGVTQLNTAINQGSVTMPGGYPLESPGSAFLGGGEPGSSKVPAAIDEKEARDFENGLTTAGQGEPSPREERRPAP